MLRIVGENLDCLHYFTGMPVKMDFYLNITAAAGRDLLCRKESSCAASPGPDSVNDQGGIAPVGKAECMGQG